MLAILFLLIQETPLDLGRRLLDEAEAIVPTSEADVRKQRVKAVTARDELEKVASAEAWIEISRAHRLAGEWALARAAIDRAVELEASPGAARYERGLLPLRYMLHAMPFLNPSAAGALTDREHVWSLNLSIAHSVRYGWLFADPVVFNDPDDPLIRAAAADFAALDEDGRLAGEAVIAYLQRRTARADYYLRRALERRPDDPDLLMTAGLNALRVAEYAEALDFVDRSLQRRPAQPFGYAMRGLLAAIVRGDWAAAFDDLRRFGPYVEPSWGVLLEPVGAVRSLYLRGEWDKPEFREALTRLAGALQDVAVPPADFSGQLGELLKLLYTTLGDEPLQKATVELAIALRDGGVGAAKAQLDAFADAFAGSPLGQALGITADMLKEPELQRRVTGLTWATIRVFKDGTADERIARWADFKERWRVDLEALLGENEAFRFVPGLSGIDVTTLAAGVIADGARSRLYAEQGDEENEHRALDSILKETDDALWKVIVLGRRGKEHPILVGILRVVRAAAFMRRDRPAEAMVELKRWLMVPGDGVGEAVENLWSLLSLASEGKWDSEEFRRALSEFGRGLSESEGHARVLYETLRDPGVQEKGIALVKAVADEASTDEQVAAALTAAVEALKTSPWREDQFLTRLVASDALMPIVRTARAWAAVRGATDAADEAKRWESFLVAWNEHRALLHEALISLSGSHDDHRILDYWPVLSDLVEPLVCWMQADLYGRSGQTELRKQKLEVVLKALDAGAFNEKLAPEAELAAEIFAAMRAIVHRELGDLGPARRELARFVEWAEAVAKDERLFAPIPFFGDAYLRIPPFVAGWKLLATRMSDWFEDIDIDLGVRWAVAVGIDREIEVRRKRVRLAIAAKDFEGAMKLAEPLQQVDVLVAQERWDDALKLCGELRRADPWDDRVVAREVMVLRGRGRLDEACAVLAELIERDRFHRGALAERAALLETLGRHGAARLDTERLLRMDPTSPAGEALLESLHEKSQDLGPERNEPWYYVARGTLADVDRAIEMDPHYRRAYLVRGRLRAAAGDAAGALADFAASRLPAARMELEKLRAPKE